MFSKSKVYHSALIERAFVKDELAKGRASLLHAREDFQRVYRHAKEFLGLFDFIRFSWLLSECDRKQRASFELKNVGSIARLRQYRFGSRENDYGTIVNLAGIQLSTLQKEVLCRGVDFGIPPGKLSEPEILAEFEILERQVARLQPGSKELVERSRCDLAAVAREYATKKADTRDFSLTREHQKVLTELRMNDKLVITRPDKGRATVLMRKDAYVEKMMCILGDTNKFLTLGPVSQFDQTAKIEQKLRKYLGELVKSKEITESIFEHIVPVGSQRPRMYGLPKTHKPDVPLRPILSMCGSAQYSISKWLCELLSPVVKYFGARCVKDSFTFSDAVKTSGLSRNGYMCSFDVVSLFTNVPLAEVIDICADALFRNDDIDPEITTLSEASFKELMRLATSGVEFSFNGTMYRQVDGVAMGSPLGPALANIFVGYYEKKIPQNEWPELYYRYVDDVFSHFQNKHSSVIFFKRLNSLHPALQFTMEGEVDGSLPFLEVRVTRVASGMVTSLYRKPTFTGLYTPWDSFSPTVYKINLVRALTFRINRVCSPAVVQEELDTLRTILTRNGYPGQILDRWVTPSSAQPERRIGPQLCPLTLRIPWLGRGTEKLVERANDAVRLAYFAGKVRAVYKTKRAFNLPKERIPTPSQSNLIYLFECRHCKSRYVGKTSQRFGERIKQHVPKHLVDAPTSKKRRGRPPKVREKPAEGYQSAIACHLAANEDCRKSFRESAFSILCRCRSKHHQDVLEAMFIHVLQPKLCKQKSFVTNLVLFNVKHSHKN